MIMFVDLDGKDYSLLFDDFKNVMSKLVYQANTLIKHEVKQDIKEVNSVAKKSQEVVLL